MKSGKLILSAFLSASIAIGSCMSIPSSAATYDYSSSCKAMVQWINELRAQNGADPVKVYTMGASAANLRAKECAQSFSHTRPNGARWYTALDERNISYTHAGENIYWYSISGCDPESAFDSWKNSQGHFENMIAKDFTYVSIGYYSDSTGQYWVQLFSENTSVKTISKGDVNGDGAIDAVDASYVLAQYSFDQTKSKFAALSDKDYLYGDMNNDKTVDAVDASVILKYYSQHATGRA